MYCILVKTIPPSHEFCVHRMHFFPLRFSPLCRQSQGRLCPALQFLAFQSHTTQPLHAERGVWPHSCLFLPLCGLAAAQAGPKAFSNLVMSCKVTCLPPRLGGCSESGIPGISLPRWTLRVGWMILYTHTHISTISPHLRYAQALPFEQPWHCSAHPPCPWVSWDARNNWWRCRVMLSVQAGQQTPLTNPPLRGNVLLPPFTLIVLNSPLFHRDLPFNRCH